MTFPYTAAAPVPHRPGPPPRGPGRGTPGGRAQAASSDATETRQLLLPLMMVTLVLPLALPYALISVGIASPMRTVMPLYSLLIGIYLARRQPGLLVGFVLALFAFTPFLRRVVDYHAGYSIFNPILLAPYAALLPTLPSLGRRLLGHGGGLQWPFAVLTLSIVYGCFVALLNEKLASVAAEPIRWLLPMTLCTFIMEHPENYPAIRRAVMMSLALIMPVLTVYGIEQYLSPPLWDVLWMQNVDIGAFGQPVAYEIRVFSMMNSPLSVGIFGVSAMILLVGEGPLSLLIAVSIVPLLAITLLREAWIIAPLGFAVMMVLASTGRRITLVLGIVVSAVVFTGLLTSHVLPASITNPLITRFSSLSDVQSGTDTSAGDRKVTYDSMFRRLSESPWGEGFGANASAIAASQKRDLVPLDSSVLEGTVVYGVVVGAAYFVAILGLFFAAMRAGLAARGPMAAHVALLVALLATTPIGQNLIGEAAIIGWISIGLLLANQELVRRRAAAVVRDPRLGAPRLA